MKNKLKNKKLHLCLHKETIKQITGGRFAVIGKIQERSNTNCVTSYHQCYCA